MLVGRGSADAETSGRRPPLLGLPSQGSLPDPCAHALALPSSITQRLPGGHGMALPSSIHQGLPDDPGRALPGIIHQGLPDAHGMAPSGQALASAPIIATMNTMEGAEASIENMEAQAVQKIQGQSCRIAKRPAAAAAHALVLDRPAKVAKKPAREENTNAFLAPSTSTIYKGCKIQINPSQPNKMRVFYLPSDPRKDKKVSFLPGDIASEGKALKAAKQIIDIHA
eukprot:308148-Amphidinium_carterae.3